MKFKLTTIAATVAALASASAFAVKIDPNAGPQAGQVTYYIAGASAQAGALTAVAKQAFFQTPADVVTVTGGSVNGAWYGIGLDSVTGGTNLPLLVIYRNSNGSGSGVRQLQSNTLADIAALPAVGASAVNADNTNLVTISTLCGATAGVSGSYTASCAAAPLQSRVPDVALSDVEPKYLAGTLPSGAGYVSADSLVIAKNAMQGFGVAANPNAYAALQGQNIAEGLLPATCAGSAAISCQPSIRKEDYASLISAEGSIKDVTALFNNTTLAGEVVVCRRTDASGTQATSNIFFLNNKCGTVGFNGSYNTLGAADSAPGQIVFNEGTNTAAVTGCLNNTAGYRLGVISLENANSTYKFVKIDGVSPDNTYDGAAVVADGKRRQQFASGSYKYALEMYSAIKPTASAAVVAFQGALNSKLGDSTQSDLAGIGYLDLPGTWVANSTTQKQSRISRQGNNCGPLLP